MSDTILLVTHDPARIPSFERPLGRDGRNVVVCADNLEALETFQRRQPRLVVIDAVAPDFLGLELCQVLKATPQNQGTPILVVAERQDGKSLRARANQHGADQFLETPVADDELIRCVQQLVEGEPASAVVAQPAPPAATGEASALRGGNLLLDVATVTEAISRFDSIVDAIGVDRPCADEAPESPQPTVLRPDALHESLDEFAAHSDSLLDRLQEDPASAASLKESLEALSAAAPSEARAARPEIEVGGDRGLDIEGHLETVFTSGLGPPPTPSAGAPPGAPGPTGPPAPPKTAPAPAAPDLESLTTELLGTGLPEREPWSEGTDADLGRPRAWSWEDPARKTAPSVSAVSLPSATPSKPAGPRPVVRQSERMLGVDRPPLRVELPAAPSTAPRRRRAGWIAGSAATTLIGALLAAGLWLQSSSPTAPPPAVSRPAVPAPPPIPVAKAEEPAVPPAAVVEPAAGITAPLAPAKTPADVAAESPAPAKAAAPMTAAPAAPTVAAPQPATSTPRPAPSKPAPPPAAPPSGPPTSSAKTNPPPSATAKRPEPPKPTRTAPAAATGPSVSPAKAESPRPQTPPAVAPPPVVAPASAVAKVEPPPTAAATAQAEAPAAPVAAPAATHPAVVHKVPPVFPPKAVKRAAGSTIVLKVLVGENGRPVRVVVEQGQPELEAAAIEAVLRWEYRPATEDGKPVRGWATERFTVR